VDLLPSTETFIGMLVVDLPGPRSKTSIARSKKPYCIVYLIRLCCSDKQNMSEAKDEMSWINRGIRAAQVLGARAAAVESQELESQENVCVFRLVPQPMVR
jgi:hypothetical protein